jgi:hypothetical protein
VAVDPVLLATRVISHQLRHQRTFLAAAGDVIDNPPEGTPARDDCDYIETHPKRGDLRGLRWWAHKSAVLNMSAAAEQAGGLMAVVDGGELMPLPAMTLGRAIYEACINTFWLIQPEVSTEQRVARWAGRLLHDTQEPPNALASFGEHTEAAQQQMADVTEARALGQELMTGAGFKLQLRGRDRADETSLVTYEGATSGLYPRVTRLVARFTPNQQSLWQLFSGAAHSRGWLVEGIEGDAATVLTSVVLPLLDVSDALVIELGAYLGLDPRSTVERTHLQRRAMLASAQRTYGTRANWDAYRAAGGAPSLPRFS